MHIDIRTHPHTYLHVRGGQLVLLQVAAVHELQLAGEAFGEVVQQLKHTQVKH